MNDISSHYDILINENNDPVNDLKPLRDYMDKWDGLAFLDEMKLNKTKSVLEIGVGTGRLAIRVAPYCKSFLGIDISHKTAERAKYNLRGYQNVEIVNADFLEYETDDKFDVIYSSLTFMHIENKQAAINKVNSMLKNGGRFVLSIDKNQSEIIDIGISKIKVFPDSADEIKSFMQNSGLRIISEFETELAVIFSARK